MRIKTVNDLAAAFVPTAARASTRN